MFSKNSRYRKLPDDVAVDAQGRRLASRSLRPLPAVQGVLTHATQQGERLDHLAQTYYGQPRKWWRICDANPIFLSPLALLGREPLDSTRFDLIYKSEDPPWVELLCALQAQIGIEAARLGEAGALPEEKCVEGVCEIYWDLVVIHNRLNITAGHIAVSISDRGFTVSRWQTSSPIGKPLNIPPDSRR